MIDHKNYGLLTLIRESWKKSKTRDRHRARYAGKKYRAQRCTICMCSCALDFFPEIALGDGPRKWHIFLLSAAYLPLYWHMPFDISTIRKTN